ncbi:MAG: hypothetical protein K6B68_13670 [Eubacterium sp.]|nr:hypothetical protein [Eubacterium sp.]
MERQNKDKYLSVRCTDSEKEKIMKKAFKLGKKLPEYVVDSCLAPAERPSKRVKKALIKEVKVSNQINQIDAALKNYKLNMTKGNLKSLEMRIKELKEIILC